MYDGGLRTSRPTVVSTDFTIPAAKRQSSFPFPRRKVNGEVYAMKEKIITDPFGSYTGLVKDPKEKPVQDADDL